MNERYNYLKAVTDDVREYIKYEIDLAEWSGNRDGLEKKLNDELWTEGSVTGNARGSYYCNAWMAEEAISHNWDLLAEALSEFGKDGTDVLKQGAEAMDVTIRCYLLGQAIAEALDELEEELTGDDEDEEEYPVAAGINSQLGRKHSQGASPWRSGKPEEKEVIQ